MNTKEEKLGDGRKQENATRICKKKTGEEKHSKKFKGTLWRGKYPMFIAFFVCLFGFLSVSVFIIPLPKSKRWLKLNAIFFSSSSSLCGGGFNFFKCFCSTDNHFFVSTFFSTLLSLPVWVLVINVEKRIVKTVTDFYFYFKILYELCIS